VGGARRKARATATCRLAIVADVHADVHALRDALAQIERLGCDGILCVGDLVDWGVFPEETISLVRERRIPCIRGNHDKWATAEGHDESGWDLTDRAVEFLESLSTHLSRTLAGVRVVAWHARPGSDVEGV
jgi:predicted phosphodiesterase